MISSIYAEYYLGIHSSHWTVLSEITSYGRRGFRKLLVHWLLSYKVSPNCSQVAAISINSTWSNRYVTRLRPPRPYNKRHKVLWSLRIFCAFNPRRPRRFLISKFYLSRALTPNWFYTIFARKYQGRLKVFLEIKLRRLIRFKTLQETEELFHRRCWICSICSFNSSVAFCILSCIYTINHS